MAVATEPRRWNLASAGADELQAIGGARARFCHGTRANGAAADRDARVTDARVGAAMRKVPRDAFVPGPLRELSYTDRPLPIGHDQTISQPYIVGLMTEALQLKPTDRVPRDRHRLRLPGGDSGRVGGQSLHDRNCRAIGQKRRRDLAAARA